MISQSKLIQSIYDATWGRWVFAGAYDRFLRNSEKSGLAEKRRDLMSRARGRTLEIATGTGLNLPHYGNEVTELVLTEPYEPMLTQLERKLDRLGLQAEVKQATAEELPFPEESFDTVVGTMILCTAQDPSNVLSEAARVLKKGGQYLFLEHIRNPDPKVARRQDLVQPAWYLFGNGCHCNREAHEVLGQSPLVVEEMIEDKIPKAWSIVEAMVMGRAVRPTSNGEGSPAVDGACRAT